MLGPREPIWPKCHVHACHVSVLARNAFISCIGDVSARNAITKERREADAGEDLVEAFSAFIKESRERDTKIAELEAKVAENSLGKKNDIC